MKHIDIKSALVAASFALAITLSVATAAQPDGGSKNEQKIVQLREPYLQKAVWKDAGFKTPQATAQTFMWATREGDWKRMRSCLASPDDREPSAEDVENLKNAQEQARGFQALAIKEFEDGTVELKFKVTGWQEDPFVHSLKKVSGEWKLFGSTRDARW